MVVFATEEMLAMALLADALGVDTKCESQRWLVIYTWSCEQV